MVLNVRFYIGSDGDIQYSSNLSGQDIPIGEIGKLQIDALTKVHDVVKESVDKLNEQLKTEGITDKLANH